jgi:aspartate kinase
VLTINTGARLDQDGFRAMAGLFGVFSRHHTSIDLIATTEGSVSLTVDGAAPLEGLLRDLAGFGRVGVARGRAIVAVVGERLKLTPGISGHCFGALEAINVELISMGANETNLSFVVRQEDAGPALRALHAALFSDPPAKAAPKAKPAARLTLAPMVSESRARAASSS